MAQGVTIDFTANLARFTSQVDKATADLSRFQTNASRIATQIKTVFGAAGIGIGVAGLAAFAKSGIDAADSLNDLSERVGVSVKDLASFKLAAQLADTSLESIGDGISRLSRAIGEAEAGNKRMAEALQQLGITARDPKEAFYQLADGVKSMQDPAQRAAVLTTIFSQRYTELIPLLNQGSDGLRRAAQRSESFADAMARLAPEAGKFNDQLDELKQQAAGASAALLERLVPSLNETLRRVRELMDDDKGIQALVRALAGLGKLPFDALFPNPRAAETAKERIVELREEIESLQKKLVVSRSTGVAVQALIGTPEEIQQQIRILENQIQVLEKIGDKIYKPKKQAPVEASMSFVVYPPEKAKEIDKARMQLEDLQEAMRMSAEELERFSKLRQADQEVWDFDRERIELVTARQKEYADAVEASRQQILDMVDPTARLVRQLLDLDRFEGVLDPELLALARLEVNAQIDAVRNLQPELEKTKTLAEEIGLTFTSAFEDAIAKGEDFSDVLQAIEQDIIKLLARTYVTDPLLSAVKGFDIGSLIGGLLPFASGGVMTASGPLPLKRYATGGIASTPQLALFGEGSGAEAYVPLPDGRRIPVAMQGAGGVVVNVINNGSGQATTRERMEGGTRIIDVVVEATEARMAQSVATGGTLATTLERTYGLNRSAGAY